MGSRWNSLVLASLLVVARAAYADLAAPGHASGCVPPAAVAEAASPAAEACSLAPARAALSGASEPGWPACLAPEAAPPAPPAVVAELPPAPDSAALCLSALAGFGVWQLGRSARRLHLGVLPDWYHTDAVQVGHATPLDLEFNHAALAICAFEEPVARPAFSDRIPRELCSRLQPQFFLPIESPRGPPSRG